MRKINACIAIAALTAANGPAWGQACPADLSAAEALIGRLPQTGKVDTSNCVWGCSDKYNYDTSSLNILGAKPLSAETTIINDRISQIIFRLPGMPGRYLAAFSQAMPKGKCSDSDYDDYDSCEWDGGDKVRFGALESVKLNLTIMEKNVTYLYCDYEVINR
ncbi:MAG TPA: hypothetical protein VI381_06695 [Allosphingosinicella sp.]